MGAALFLFPGQPGIIDISIIVCVLRAKCLDYLPGKMLKYSNWPVFSGHFLFFTKDVLPMKNKWQKIICIGLALVVLSLTVLACPGPDNGDNSQRPDPNKISLVTPERQAPTTFDLSGDIAVASATPEAGAVVTTNGMTLEVPPKAVAAETPVQVVTLANAPPTPGYDPDMDNSLAAAISLSPVYDLGPDGISFKKPVTVTLPYDASLLTSPENESYVQIAYYNGVSWVAVGGKVDTNNKTVTAQFTAFPGIAVSTVVLIGTWATFLTIASYKAYEHYVADPIAWGEAAKYITPKKSDDGSKVAEYVKRAIVGRKKNADGKGFTNIPLQDPKNPGQINPEAKEMLLNDLENVRIGFDETDKGQKSPVYPDYKSSTGGSFNDWVMPEEYFAKDMQFDCKNISNAYLTIMRSVGIEAKCVDGYTTARHVWVEMKIEGRPYVLDIDGGIQPLDVAYKKDGLKRPQGIKGEGYMYNENGQDPYKENWWLDELQVNVNDSKAYPGGEVSIEVFGAPGMALNIDLTIEGPDGSSTSYSGITDITSGIYRLTLPLKAGIIPGVYVVTAANTEKDIFGLGIYSVVMPELFAGLITQR